MTWLFRGANTVSWTGYSISNETRLDYYTSLQGSMYVTTGLKQVPSLPSDLLKSLFSRGWRWNVLKGYYVFPPESSYQKNKYFHNHIISEARKNYIGHWLCKNQVPSLYAEKGPALQLASMQSVSCGGKSMGLWLRQTCALPYTAQIALANPFNFSQLKFPHLKEVEIIM